MSVDINPSHRRQRIRNRDRAKRPLVPETSTPPVPKPELPILNEPRDGEVFVIDRLQPLLNWLDRNQDSSAPVAVDAERASSFRYSDRAYLLQFRTEEAGTALVDPTAMTLPPRLHRTLASREWIFHAALQDLPCLAELNLIPERIFDTELAARLLGFEKVGLGAVVEKVLGVSLAKEHSAADWSQRPLPKPWLVYAALDVDVLIDVRNELETLLRAAGKWEWAKQEFAHIVANPLPPARSEPWRAIHGLGKIRRARNLAIARELWLKRDEIARVEDIAVHRLFHDRNIVAVAAAAPKTKAEFLRLAPRRVDHADEFWRATRAAMQLPQVHWPSLTDPDKDHSHRSQLRKAPESAERVKTVRAHLQFLARDLSVPVENLLTPALLRALISQGRLHLSSEEIAFELSQLGARPWQVELVSPVIAGAFQEINRVNG